MASECIIDEGPYAGQPGLLFDNWNDMMDYTYLYGMPDTQLVVFREGGDWDPVEDGEEYMGLVPFPGSVGSIEPAIHVTEPDPYPVHITWTGFVVALARFRTMLAKAIKWIGSKTIRRVIVGTMVLGGGTMLVHAVTGLLYPQTDWWIDDTSGTACAVTGGRICCIYPGQKTSMECKGGVTPTTDIIIYAVVGIGAMIVLVVLLKMGD